LVDAFGDGGQPVRTLQKKRATTFTCAREEVGERKGSTEMKNHSNTASRVLGILAIAAAFGWLQPATAYGQTAEGTVIVNTATVTYTDANTNTYSSVNDNVSVTVGFSAGIDVVAAQATATPASPSTLNTLVFNVNNIGNGIDSVTDVPPPAVPLAMLDLQPLVVPGAEAS
jgi:hypothetical protein